MYSNVHIIGVGTYNPQREVQNDFFINHFKQQGQDEHVRNLMGKLGRKTRRLAHESETSISMSVKAAQRALEEARLIPEDIDMIISATDTPEFLMPSCALIIRNQLHAYRASSVFDLNSNCIGMISAMDVASRYLKTDSKYKRALVVGSLVVSPFAREDDIITYPIVGDGAAAVILEIREESRLRGVLGSRMFTDDTYNDTIRFPACGMRKASRESSIPYERKMEWKPFDFSFLSEKWAELINGLLGEYEYTSKDVSHYFMSQFSKEDIKDTMLKLNTGMEKVTFVADKYGYTGTASPIMAFAERVEEMKFHDDELIIFCSVAAGYTMGALIYKW